MRKDGSTVLLSDAEEEAAQLAELLSACSAPTTCYNSVAELVGTQPLSSISVLVLHFRPLPKGILLATIGRMNLEYPAMQKVAVLESTPPLLIAEYLTACGVDLLWNGATDDGAEQLASVVNRLHERTRWIAS